MSNKHTLLVEFGDNKPSFKSGMDVLGGKLEGVSFDDQFAKNESARDKLEELRLLISDTFDTCLTESDEQATKLFAEIEQLI